jgi:hypothetical protein
MKLKRLLPLLSLLLLPQIGFAQKKSSVNVIYDKSTDITCGIVDLGNVAAGIAADYAWLTASYCSPGKTLQQPTLIRLQLLSKASVGATRGPQIIFLLDGTDRLLFDTQLNYSSSPVLANVGRIIIVNLTTTEFEKICTAKLVKFQVFGRSYKLKQKDLAKLNAFARAGSTASP